MKQTLSNYIWSMISIIIIFIMIIVSTPFAKYVSDGIVNSVDAFYTAVLFRLNDGYKEVIQNKDWDYKIVGVTTPLNSSCTTVTYNEYLDMQNIPHENENDNNPDNTDNTEKYAIAISLTKYTGKSHRVIVPNLYEDNGKVFVVTSVGIPTEENKTELDHHDDNEPRANILGDNTGKIASVIVSQGVDINPYAFHNCNSLNTLILTNTNLISNYAFSSCSKLVNVSLGDNTSIVGDYAFANCENLKELDFGEKLTGIGKSAFYNCVSLESVRFSSSLSSIDDSAFIGCTALSKANFENTNITYIGNSAFKNCTSLEGSLRLPSTLTVIEKEAFYNCKGLNGTLYLPDNIDYIYDSAFENCSFIKTDFTNLKSLSVIGKSAFKNCKNMSFALVAPASLMYIGEEAFSGCYKCSDVILNEGLIGAGNNAFSGITKKTRSPLIIPSTCQYLSGKLKYQDDANKTPIFTPPSVNYFKINGVSQFIIANGNTSFKVENNTLYTVDGRIVSAYT